MFSLLQESQAPLCVTVTWEDKCHHSCCHLFLQFDCDSDAICYSISHWLVVLSCIFSQLLVQPQALLTVKAVQEAEKTLTLCKSSSASTKYPCVISMVSSTNPKYSPLPTAARKIILSHSRSACDVNRFLKSSSVMVHWFQPDFDNCHIWKGFTVWYTCLGSLQKYVFNREFLSHFFIRNTMGKTCLW